MVHEVSKEGCSIAGAICSKNEAVTLTCPACATENNVQAHTWGELTSVQLLMLGPDYGLLNLPA